MTMKLVLMPVIMSKRKSAKTDYKRPDVSARVTAASTYVGFSEPSAR